MKPYQSRSQLIRTSLSGSRKNQLTYNRLPVSYEKIESYKQQLIRTAHTPIIQKRTLPATSTPDRKFSSEQQAFTKFTQTRASTFSRGQGISHRIISTSQKFRSTGKRSFFNEQNNEQQLQRPSTEFQNHRNPQVKIRMNAYSPLEVINTRMTEENNESVFVGNESSRKRLGSGARRWCESEQGSTRRNVYETVEKKRNFLRKGSSLDKSLVINLLKSKFQQKITSSSSNYANARSNALIYEAMKKQIPHEFRDIIGAEEMLRMSKILSGIGLKTVDMNQKIQKAISSKITANKIKTMESNADDNETLKSIKRW